MSDALNETTATRRSRTRGIAVTTMLIVGTLLMIGAGIGIWAQRQALDTDNWVDLSSELIENEPIRTAVGLYLVESLYDSDQVKQRSRGQRRRASRRSPAGTPRACSAPPPPSRPGKTRTGPRTRRC
jgi:hypothetical protein